MNAVVFRFFFYFSA
ncbi:pheST operon leader peptide PheM [Chimaeribacter coloradensis]|nr:pheST operon leader peptide PheM [Chimaeribacter coloradensis]